MASAAAVGADAARSPIGNDIEQSNGVTSAIVAKDEAQREADEEDEDEDIQKRVRRGDRVMAKANGDDEEEDRADDGEGDDLFGEEEDELPENPMDAPRRELDDAELDSGDDEGRMDRVGDEENAEPEATQEQAIQVMDMEIPRQPRPEPSDGEMYLMKVPDFMSIQPNAWRPAAFQPPDADHHKKQPSSTFSAFNTALTTIRWRRSPSKPSELQSNARVLRWSDGSLTLQLASEPGTQYEIGAQSLAPPQRNPIKPTPTSINTLNAKGGRRGANTGSQASGEEKYDTTKDSLTYLVEPVESAAALRITQKLTAGLQIKPSSILADTAIEQLQSSLAAASGAKVATSANMMQVEEDPELAKRKAELAEREKMRARKRIEAQQERERERTNRTLGRSGLSSGRYGGGGLSAGMLEDEDGLPSTSGGGRKGPAKARGQQQRRRRANSEYSSEEDYGRRGFQSKQDEYDEEDDFVAPSDEEEVVEDDEDEDDGIVEDRGQREGSAKRRPGADEDADGEDDDELQAAAGRKRRKVVMDDEDDEE